MDGPFICPGLPQRHCRDILCAGTLFPHGKHSILESSPCQTEMSSFFGTQMSLLALPCYPPHPPGSQFCLQQLWNSKAGLKLVYSVGHKVGEDALGLQPPCLSGPWSCGCPPHHGLRHLTSPSAHSLVCGPRVWSEHRLPCGLTRGDMQACPLASLGRRALLPDAAAGLAATP